jgi:hypothetical protein
VVVFEGSILIFLLVCDSKDVCVKWMFLSIWDATKLNALMVAFRVNEKLDKIPNEEIIAPAMFMAFNCWK